MSTRLQHRRRIMRDLEQEAVSRREWAAAGALVVCMLLSAYFFGG